MARGLLFDACLRVVELLAGLKPGAYIRQFGACRVAKDAQNGGYHEEQTYNET